MACRAVSFSAPSSGAKAGFVAAPQRDVQVRGASRMLGERLGHEAGDLAVLARHLLGGVLEPGRVVGGFQRVGVHQVRLDLARAVLGLDALQSRECAQRVVQVGEQRIERVGVLQRVGVDIVLERRAVRVEQIELELDADLGGVAQRGKPCQHPLEHGAGIEQRRAAVVRNDVGDDVADPGPPRQRPDRSRGPEPRTRRDIRRPNWSAAASRSRCRRCSSPETLRRRRIRCPAPGPGTAMPGSACPAAWPNGSLHATSISAQRAVVERAAQVPLGADCAARPVDVD